MLESAFDLLPQPAAAQAPAANAPFSAPAAIGPMSIRSLAAAQISANTPLAPESNWYAGVNLPGGVMRYAHAQCLDSPESFYVISGVNQNFQVSPKNWRYDAPANQWIELAPIPEGQEGAAGVCYAGKIYVLGGGGSNQFYIYDITANTWSAGPALPRPVWGAAAGAWQGKVYLLGGDQDFEFGGASNEVDIYNIAKGTWSSTGKHLPFAASAPGYVQAGPYLYLAGGWGELAPIMNITATQRYNMSTDNWELGPAFSSGRADFAMALTDQALYAIGGDRNDGSATDPVNLVERLDWTAWPGGAWTSTADPLPRALTSNSAGFCSTSLFPTEIFSVGGYTPLNNGEVSGENLFLALKGESCYSNYSEVPWVSMTPSQGEIPGDGTSDSEIRLDASDLTIGEFKATLVFKTNDPAGSPLYLPVKMTVIPPDHDMLVVPDYTGRWSYIGTTVTYTLQITNTGIFNDAFDLSLSGNVWETTPSKFTTDWLDPGESDTLTVKVVIPPEALNNQSDVANLTFTSRGDPRRTRVVTLTTKAYYCVLFFAFTPQ